MLIIIKVAWVKIKNYNNKLAVKDNNKNNNKF